MNIKNRIALACLKLGLILSFCFNLGYAQTISTLSTLPTIVDESSGIEETGSNKVWTFNDSGGAAELYLCDTLGNLIKTLQITGAGNRDWEDITKDDQGNFYIGNIGNNNNANTDLTIFKIPNPDGIAGNSVAAQVITFSYEDQYSFPPPNDGLYFDCEALIWFNGNLYLCTKARSQPMKTSLYKIPDSPGTHVATKISSYTMEDGNAFNYFNYWVTAGDISPDGSKFVLLSQDKFWIFHDFIGDDFFSGNVDVYSLGGSTQKEAICFIDNTKLYITDEYWSSLNIGRKLYKVILNETALALKTSNFFAETQDRDIVLHWQSRSEVNIQEFVVEHSLDAIEWEVLANRKTKGMAFSYEFLHLHPGPGHHHYRLKQIEYDGNVEYSAIEIVFIPDNKIVIYPNPTLNQLNFQGLSSQYVGYEIRDLSGKSMMAGHLDRTKLNISHLTPGIYFLELNLKNRKMIQRIVVE